MEKLPHSRYDAAGTTFQMQRAPDMAVQMTDNPLHGLSADEFGRYAHDSKGVF